MHSRARERGVNRRLYAVVRALVTPPMRAWFRVRVSGADQVPARGAAIVAPNHKSFLDAFFVGISTHRHVRFIAKAELMKGPIGWLFVRLGAFPVRRGESDAEAIETARAVLRQGGLLVMFPEGTRVDDPNVLGSPHHGAGRLALETGAPIIPTAIAGTHKLWLGPLPKPRRVQVTFLPPIDARQLDGRADAVDEIIDRQVWPSVQREYGRQLKRPGLILAALAATGLGAGLLARRRARRPPRLLGVIEPGKVRRRKARRQRREWFARIPHRAAKLLRIARR
ncbi:MAG TPA: lysophospholipid acyltransferase family protein [Solirubrobacteraceae bacterium]|nr:lysophospholipid acyltransferase family protein [Solirubrobacteraceae bacterium]